MKRIALVVVIAAIVGVYTVLFCVVANRILVLEDKTTPAYIHLANISP